MELVLLTLGLGSLSMLTTAAISKRFFTPCFWYWTGWILGLVCAELSRQVDILPSITPLGRELMVRAHIGAFAGFLISSLWVRTITRQSKQLPTRQFSNPVAHLPRWVWLLVALQACLGVLLLAQRVFELGINITSLINIRQSFLQEAYLQESLPPLLRVYNYITLAALIAPVLRAKIDATSETINFQSLILIFSATVPGGLSTGGRVWIASVLSFYLVAYFIAIDTRLSWPRMLHVLRAFSVPVFGLVLLFAGIGLVRDAGAISSWFHDGAQDNPVVVLLSPVYIYAGISVAAVGPYSEYAAQQDWGWGQFTFPWFANQAARLGVNLESRYVNLVLDSRSYVTRHFDPILGSTHASIIPMLIADFGEGNLGVVMAVLMGLLQALFLLLKKKGLAGYMLSVVICLYGGLFSFQDALIGSSNAVIPFLATIILPIFVTLISILWQSRCRRRAANSWIISV